MNAFNQAVEAVIQANTTTSHSKPRVCKHCGREVPMMEVEVFGRKRMVQPVCECEAEEKKRFEEEAEKVQRKKDINKLFSIHNLGERFKESSIDSFMPRPGAENVYKFAKIYVNEFDSWGEESLILWGVPGNGKSHLAAAIANELDSKGKIVVFISMPELLEKIRSTFNKESHETEDKIMKALQDCDLLIIDDIGAEKVTEWVEDIIFRIVDGRYRKKQPILATSNLRPDLLADKIGERSYDRLTEMSQSIENKSTSYRKEKAAKRMQRFMK
ncbi:ATP-binding protein [Priestia megaterium]|uniref:ATP-binding protein n=1 Tax=Priestia megaterium TaxID=1404 RepID=UPI002813010B|nr:ATP-binding protein [Priestia megaterium]MDR0128655.1 ATP-binding protein [Priestia megaterium]